MERNLAMDLVRVTEAAALASARHMGRGDDVSADTAAVEAMRQAFDAIAIDGTVVIGEGPEDAIPMLYVGERVGTTQGPQVDVALDAIEGATSCATGAYNAVSVIAIADPGTLLRVPDTYMEKIACGPEGRGVIVLFPAGELRKGRRLIGEIRLHAWARLFWRGTRLGRHRSRAGADRSGHNDDGSTPKYSARQQGTFPLCKPSALAAPPGPASWRLAWQSTSSSDRASRPRAQTSRYPSLP
jgi:hypothetical protein